MSLTLRFLTVGVVATIGVLGCGSQSQDSITLPSHAGSGGGGNPSGTGASGSTLPKGTGGSLDIPIGGGNNASGGGGGTDCDPKPVGLLRDFSPLTNSDFEYKIVADKGLVAAELGSDRKPVFIGEGHPSVHTAAEFDQWYRDVPDVNVTSEFTLPFTTAANGNLVYDSPNFFPLDDQGLGNEGKAHNFHFTYELHMEFRYKGGEIFTFRGDDDVFVFVNNKLAIDLGGVHEAQTAQLDVDASAATLGMAPGNVYPIDFFQAERHTTKSSFRIETSLQFSNCTPIIIR